MKKDINWNGLWFQIRAEKGQSDMVTFQYIDGLTGKRINRNFPHRETDGFGALMLNLAKDGYPQFQPPSKSFAPPTAAQRFLLFWKGLLGYPKPPQLIWKNWKPDLTEEHHHVAWLTFTPEMEAHLETQSRKLKINTTSYLLAVLNEVCRQELCAPSSEPGLWMMPVNMRGSFPNMPLTQNCVSFVPLKTAPLSMTPEKAIESAATSIYQQLRTSLKSNQHWAFWELGQIGKWIGYSGMKLLSAKSDQSYWTGTFSDLGTWEQESLNSDPIAKRIWLIAPPGSPSYPLGATSLKWFGKRVISLKIHPSILPENVSPFAMAQKILDQMRTHFQNDLRNPADTWKSSDNRNSVPLEP
jgi:hypothetical protein